MKKFSRCSTSKAPSSARTSSTPTCGSGSRRRRATSGRSACADLARKMPGLLAAERRDRGEFLRKFYRRYEGAPVDEIQALAREAFSELVLPNAFPDGPAARSASIAQPGHRVVFLTGALDFTIAPLTPLADVIASASHADRERSVHRRARGGAVRRRRARVVPAAPREGARRRPPRELRVRATACRTSRCSSRSGNPVAVNPDPRLRRVSRERRWAVERWKSYEGTSRFSTPQRMVHA